MTSVVDVPVILCTTYISKDLRVNELRIHERPRVPLKAFMSGHFVLNTCIGCHSLRSFVMKRFEELVIERDALIILRNFIIILFIC